MHKIMHMFIIILCLLLLASNPTSQSKTEETLEKYRQAIVETKNYRTFSFDDGAPDAYPIQKDKNGYLWLKRYSPLEFYMFTGTEFRNMSAEFPKIERDSLIGNVEGSRENEILLYGKRYLYKWKGDKFIKFKFPARDKIIHCQTIGEKILCIGKEGYGVLEKGKWLYYGNIKVGMEDSHDDYVTLYFLPEIDKWYESNQVKNNSDHVLSLDSNNHLLYLKHQAHETANAKRLWHNDLYLKIFFRSKADSLFIVDAKTLNEVYGGILSPINLVNVSETRNIIYISGTDLVYKVAIGSTKHDRMVLPTGFKLCSISRMRSGDIWISYTFGSKVFISKFNETKGLLGIPVYVDDIETGENKVYNIVIDQDVFRFVTQDINSTKSESFFVLKKDTNKAEEFCIIDKLHRYNGDQCIEDGVLVYSIRDEKIKDMHWIKIYDTQSSLRDSLSIVDEAVYLDIIDVDSDNNFMLVKGSNQYYRIPMRRDFFKEKIFTQGDYYCRSLQMSGYNLILNTDIYVKPKTQDLTQGLEIIKQEGINITPLIKLKDTGYEDVDKWNDILYLSIGSKRYSLNIKKNSLTLIDDYNVPTSFTTWRGKYICMDEELNYLEVINGEKKESSFTPIKELIESTIAGTGIKAKDLLNLQLFSPQYISDDIVFFPALVCSFSYHKEKLGSDANPKGVPILDKEKTGENRNIFPSKLQITGEIGKKVSVQIPAMLYNLRTNKYEFKPDYLSITSFKKPDRTDVYVSYRCQYEGDNYTRFSLMKEGKITPCPSDFMIKTQGKDVWGIQKYTQRSGMIYKYENKLYYFKVRWHSINCDEFSRKDSNWIVDVQWHNDDIWITYNNCLVRYSLLLNKGFVIDSKYGLPKKLYRFYLSTDNNPYLLANDGIYSINMESSVNLHIPWFYANDIRLSAAKPATLNPRQNNIKIPIDILNVLFPEQMSISYRLIGFDDNWKVREYTPYLEYRKLPAGKYEFQVKAISPVGAVSKINTIKFEIKHPFYATWWAYLIYVLLGGAAIYGIFKLRTHQLKRQNLALEKTVELRTSELKERQQRIQESIEYASLIQKSILPQREELIQRFRQHFVIWKPRDIVGGDFYWLYENEAGETFFAVIDCTGHGVPGALLSMTVNSLLDKLVKDGGICSPAEILTRLHREIGAALRQTEAQTQQDGLEIALIKINPPSQTLTFSGAGLHLLHYDPESKATNHLRGNKHGLGGLKWHAELVFEEQQVPYAEKQRIYLYTDGILDQPVAEAEKPKRLGSVAWMEFLGSIAGLPMEEQETNCNELIGRMLACHEQRDDITVVGIEL